MWEVFEAIQQEKATLILNKIEFPDGRKCYAISSTQEARSKMHPLIKVSSMASLHEVKVLLEAALQTMLGLI